MHQQFKNLIEKKNNPPTILDSSCDFRSFLAGSLDLWRHSFKPLLVILLIAFLCAGFQAKATVLDNQGTGIPADDESTPTPPPTPPPHKKHLSTPTPAPTVNIDSTSSAPNTNVDTDTTTANTTASPDNGSSQNTSSQSTSQTNSTSFIIPDAVLQRIEKTDGVAAKQRLLTWQNLINNNRSNSEFEKLGLVNQFFNHTVSYKPNLDVWGQREYWATPVEFLTKDAGDCEDYAIAKYYTLVKMGVSIDKLRLAYVKAVRLNQAHMVLTFYETTQQEPLILDNLMDKILYASERPDLVPVYTFNSQGFWFTASLKKEAAQQIGTSNRMRMWLNLQNRMQRDGLN